MNADNPQLVIELANEQELAIEEPPLIEAVRLILSDHGFQHGEVSIAVVDDPTIRRLNREYLEHNYETDVLSFPLSLEPESGFIEGQLIVSTDTAQRVAIELSIAMQDELLLYVVHGALHLVGLLDKDPEHAKAMRQAEAKYLAHFGVRHHWDADRADDEAGCEWEAQ